MTEPLLGALLVGMWTAAAVLFALAARDMRRARLTMEATVRRYRTVQRPVRSFTGKSPSWIADYNSVWDGYEVNCAIRDADPNPFPRIHLFPWWR